MPEDYDEEEMVVDEGESTTAKEKALEVTALEKESVNDEEESIEDVGIAAEDSSDEQKQNETEDKSIKKTDEGDVNLSSDDEEQEAFAGNNKKKSSFARKLILSDESDDDEDKKESKSQHEKESKSSDGEEEEELLDIPPTNSNRKKRSVIIPGHVLDPDIYGDDGDSSDDNKKEGNKKKKKSYERNSIDDDEDNKRIPSPEKGKKDKVADKYKNKSQRKASEKARAKTLQKITSETQKLVREKRISLPYHKPKQLTLDQFLKKRNQAKSRVLSTIAQQPSTLGTMLNSLVKLQEDILPVIAKAEEEKEKEEAANVNGVDEEEDFLERPNITGEFQPPQEKVGNWLQKDVEICQDEPVIDDVMMTGLTGPAEIEDETREQDDRMEINLEQSTPQKFTDTAAATDAHLPNTTTSTEQSSRGPNEKDSPKDAEESDSSGAAGKGSDPVSSGSKTMNANLTKEEESTEHKEVFDHETTAHTKEQLANLSLLEGEAELASFLEEMRPKPKRLTLKERLKAMPGFEKLASLKPHVGGGHLPASGVIDLDDCEMPSKKQTKKDKNIQILMDRFLKHAGMGMGKENAKEHHHVIHVNTLEKDSEGVIQDAKTDEFDYVSNSAENDDLLDILVKPKKGLSPSGRREAVPGEKMVRLRKALQQRIRMQKTKLYEDRLKEAEAHKKVEEDENESDEEEIMEDEDIELSDSEEDEELLEEDDMPKRKKKKKTKSAFVNCEAEEENEDGDDDDDDDDEDQDSSDESDDEDLIEASGPKTKIMDADEPDPSPKRKVCRQIIYSDDEDEELPEENSSEKEKEDLNISNIVLSPSQKDKSEELESSAIANLVQSTAALGSFVPPTTDEDMADLCSGRFPTQAPLTPVESQNDCFGFDVDDDEDETNANQFNISSDNKESDDDEDDSESLFCKVSSKPPPTETIAEKQDNEDMKILTDEKENRLDNIEPFEDNLSADGDDEDVLEDEEVEDEEEPDDDEDDEEAALERELKSRSLQQSDTPKRKSTGLFGKGGRLRRKFFENEAELSGSDDGSGDEDEKGINYYEEEEGDQDDLDEDEVKNQVERAHLKQLLDRDDREIRFLQEEYLERGDLEDGKLRVRKFRWTNVDGAWGDDAAMMGDSDGEDGQDEEELKKRYEEIEKRKWLLEHPEVMEACAEESQKQLLQENKKFLKLGSKNQKKIESFLESSCSMIMAETSCSVPDTSFATLVKSQIKASAKMMLLKEKKKDKDQSLINGQLDSPPTTSLEKPTSSQPTFGNFASPDDFTSKIKRGSFLSRGSPTLSRLAEITKTTDGNGGSIKSNSRNFVFSVVTPPDQQNKQNKVPKRPAASSTQGKFLTKKIKIDRSFSSLDDSSKDNSIFKYM